MYVLLKNAIREHQRAKMPAFTAGDTTTMVMDEMPMPASEPIVVESFWGRLKKAVSMLVGEEKVMGNDGDRRSGSGMVNGNGFVNSNGLVGNYGGTYGGDYNNYSSNHYNNNNNYSSNHYNNNNNYSSNHYNNNNNIYSSVNTNTNPTRNYTSNGGYSYGTTQRQPYTSSTHYYSSQAPSTTRYLFLHPSTTGITRPDFP